VNHELAESALHAPPLVQRCLRRDSGAPRRKIEELVADGMPRKEAATAARRAFGNVTLTEDDSRNAWRWPSVEDFLADVRYGLRALRRNPAFTAISLLTIAIGPTIRGRLPPLPGCLSSSRCWPVTSPRAVQCSSIRWWRCDTSDGCKGMLQATTPVWRQANHDAAKANPLAQPPLQ